MYTESSSVRSKYLQTSDTEMVGETILYRSENHFRKNVLSSVQKEELESEIGEKEAANISFPEYLSWVDEKHKLRENEVIKDAFSRMFDYENPALYDVFSELTRHNTEGKIADESFRNLFKGVDSRKELMTRLNSAGGQFNPRMLTAVSRQLNIIPPRGLAYMTMPIISYGIGRKVYELQSYTFNALFNRISDSRVTQNINNIEVSGKSVDYPIFQFAIRNSIDYFQMQATAAIVASMNGGIWNEQNGFVFPQSFVQFMALPLAYRLSLDNMTFLGSETIDSPVLTRTIVDGTGDNGVPLVTLADVFPTATPTSFSSLTPPQMSYLLCQIVAVVTRVSKGAKRATSMWMDLLSYTQMLGYINDYKDTDPLSYIFLNRLVEMFVPVPAWSEAYPDQTTIFVAEHNTQNIHLNIPQPLSATGVSVNELTTSQLFVYQTTGVVIPQGIATAQFVCLRENEGFGKNVVEKGSKLLSLHTDNELRVMPGLLDQIKGKKKAKDGSNAHPNKPVAMASKDLNDVNRK